MSPTRCNLLILLIQLIDGLNVDQYIPTDVNCVITNPSDDKKNLSISWYLDHRVMSGVRSFDLSCDCVISNQSIFEKATHHCSPPCSHQISVNTCYDNCQCRVRSILRGLLSPTVNQSNFSTCHIGPTVPKASPVIISHPARNDDGNSIEIIFKLPAEDLYCDSTDVINGIIVNVTDHVGESYQYTYNQSGISPTNERNYNFTFQDLKYHQFWRPFNITISVNNSVGFSLFSDHMIVRGANNGDITRNDYELEFYYDGNVTPEVSTLQFDWNLSRKVQHIMDSQFITGFKITVEQQEPGNDTIIYTTSLTKNLTLNITLEPHQWYLIIGRILTEDNDTWGPEPVYKYFQTPVLPVQSTSSSSNNRVIMILLIFTIFLTVLVVTLLLYITRIHTNLAKLCFKDYNDDGDDNSCTDKINEVIGPVAESYAEYQCAPSTVENSELYPNNKENDSTSNDDSIMMEYNRRILRNTPV